VSRVVPILLSMFIIGCGYDPHHGIELADVYKVYNQDKAMFLAEGRFEDQYGVISRAFDKAEVFWADTRCPYADTIAVIVDGVCYDGIMWGCDSIYVAMSAKDLNHTCPTALMHEYGHCLRLDAHWDADADHSETGFWEFMAGVRRETCDRGW